MLFISMDHRPAIVWPASKAMRPSMESWLGAPIQRTATVVGGVCVFASVSVRASMRACAMCFGLSETWLKINDNSDIFNLPDYTLLSRPRTDKRGGGVGLYVSDKTSFKVRDDLVMNPVTCQHESLFIESVNIGHCGPNMADIRTHCCTTI